MGSLFSCVSRAADRVARRSSAPPGCNTGRGRSERVREGQNGSEGRGRTGWTWDLLNGFSTDYDKAEQDSRPASLG